ncbi:protein of unknown function [Vibrio tapetis subsp. tapetis]|uniref:Uncharacterized protein n=1 Tax=Vibrio tapetis subsp. tapetis TaxID=1671868 RepID=A0A2N8ZLS6_9VIBR|nr:protein of unknown function [Vibrio tapetis subsp. tapetis]
MSPTNAIGPAIDTLEAVSNMMATHVSNCVRFTLIPKLIATSDPSENKLRDLALNKANANPTTLIGHNLCHC